MYLFLYDSGRESASTSYYKSWKKLSQCSSCFIRDNGKNVLWGTLIQWWYLQEKKNHAFKEMLCFLLVLPFFFPLNFLSVNGPRQTLLSTNPGKEKWYDDLSSLYLICELWSCEFWVYFICVAEIQYIMDLSCKSPRSGETENCQTLTHYTERAIQDHIIPHYKKTSLPEKIGISSLEIPL